MFCIVIQSNLSCSVKSDYVYNVTFNKMRANDIFGMIEA